mmetsp:Transcript_24398/g.40090  ORF Transcript_24398/g.40090 Transcript_24398/m.40090 type:complete len:304 (+) Transcript_24398:150-1061(+)|eukprot:CAMPEP_0184650274 /NCGR_PEP_ID=MMETSP0308-20130426/7787_1 /TAXON_ID=38269 /ORGANISM="Gloeochaete witrockiana, Strain SAG 46.84" /LENGTH=303 /DNA_ID=CAMNT_0027083675 /DNA_START=125 /DNA_END=1036 /DNA_ORIENTATION=-
MNPVADAEVIHKACKGIGTDEKALISIIGYRPPEYMKAVEAAYKQNFGKSLVDVLKSETSGNFEKALVAMCRTHAENDAHTLKEAMAGAGTDEKALIEVLCARSSTEIRAISAAYKLMYSKNLEDAIKSETSGALKQVLVMLLTASRDESMNPNPQQIATDVEELYKAGQGKLGTNETTFLRIFTQRSILHLRTLDVAYGQKYGSNLKRVIDKELGGDTKRAVSAIYEYTTDRALYFAELLEDSMKGAGTHDRMLIRNVANLRGPLKEEIKAAYMRKYGKSLSKRIDGDTSGDYRKLLMAVVE